MGSGADHVPAGATEELAARGSRPEVGSDRRVEWPYRFPVRVVYGVVLAVSLAVNGYLLADRVGNDYETKPTRASQATERPLRSVQQRTSPPKRAPAAFADLDREKLERRVAEAEAKLDTMLPLEEKFDASPRSSEAEARARRIFDDILGPDAYVVECHGVVCKLDTDISPNDWQLTMFRHAPGSFERSQIGETTYLELKTASEAAGINYVVDLMYQLQESPRTAECKEANPTKGVVTLALKLDASTRRVSVVAGGPLGNQSGGICIRNVLEDLVAQKPLPPEATALVEEPFPFWVP
jgi:hypothetical protein